MGLENKYIIDTPENKGFLKEIEAGLVAFGRGFASPKGSSWYLGDDGTPWKDRPRETWVTARMAHVYSLAHLLGYPGARELAQKAIEGLTGELHDGEHGGWYAGIAADGSILPTKQCYAHAFVILAATSGIAAGVPGARELAKDALETYDLRFWNEEEGLSCDTWNTEFTVLDGYRGLNANMHSVEAFLAAADVLGDEKYRVRAGRIIGRVLGWAGGNSWRIPEHYNSEWVPDLECNRDRPDDPFKPYGATPGHGLEWARLITQWALSSFPGDPEKRAPYIDAAENLYRRAVRDAWDADGAPGIVYTTDWNGTPVIHDRMHWTLAEAINTAASLHRVTGKCDYALDFYRFCQYLDACVLDHVHGSWFHQLDRNNKLIGTVWPGKSDVYHALQATLIPYRDPSLSIVPGVRALPVLS